jgi:hypothetical protein
VGGSAPANDGSADIVMAGSIGLSSVIDTAYSVNSLSFASSAGAFTLSGNTLTIGSGGITNNSNSAQTITASISLNSGVTSFSFTNNASGTSGLLTIGAVTGNATTGKTQNLTITAANLGGINLNGSIGDGIAGGQVSLTIVGPGTTTISASNFYSGSTTVASGNLLVTGGLANTNVIVQNGATLSGNGTVGNGGGATLTVNTGGVLSPGTGSTYDALTVNDNVILNGTLSLIGKPSGATSHLSIGMGNTLYLGRNSTLSLSGTYDTISTYVLYSGNYSGSFQFLNGLPAGMVVYYDNPTEIYLAPVPEPASILLFGSGMIAVGAWIIRRRKSASCD